MHRVSVPTVTTFLVMTSAGFMFLPSGSRKSAARRGRSICFHRRVRPLCL